MLPLPVPDAAAARAGARLLGLGETLAGRLLLFDALESTFTELKLRRDPNCPVCSTEAVEARRLGRPLSVAGAADAPFLLGGSFAEVPAEVDA